MLLFFFFFSSRRRHTRYIGDWSSDVCSSDLQLFGRTAEELLLLTELLTREEIARARSEERRVGKESRSRWSPYHKKKKKTQVSQGSVATRLRRDGFLMTNVLQNH